MRELGLITALALVACGGTDPSSSTGGGGTAWSGGSSATSMAPGPSQGGGPASTSSVGGQGGAGQGGSGGDGGGGGGTGLLPNELDALLDLLRADLGGTLLTQSRDEGWPAPVEGGRLFVSTDPAMTLLAGDHDGFTGTPMTADQGFSWLVLPTTPGHAYKLSDGVTFEADPWGRAYLYDAFGRLSLVDPTVAHLERHFEVEGMGLLPRLVRVWVPAGSPTHLLYAQDGQNLFDPMAPWGGWQLDQSLPDGMMVVAIDNTPARMDEYTHVLDDPFDSGFVGGQGDSYAAFLEQMVRPLVQSHYGEPSKIGLIGSSLGGLISLHVAAQTPGSYAFVASLSGTMGWGSIAPGVTNTTMIERYATLGHTSTALYLDTGGSGTCVDSDQDGVEDDGPGSDNYCVNKQLETVLVGLGYQHDVDLWHWWEPDAPHNEAAWAARVWRPLQRFADL